MTSPRHQRAAFWDQSAGIRDEWERHGLACGSADRAAAEQAITTLYAEIGRRRPRFVWVRSPHEAQPLVGHLPTLQDLFALVTTKEPGAGAPIASDLATAVSRLRGCMDAQLAAPWFDPPPPKYPKGEPRPRLPLDLALARGVPFAEILREHVREALFTSLGRGYAIAAKRSLVGDDGPVCWYGQQEAHWIAYYDVWRRMGLARYGDSVDAAFDTWQTIARSAGWFWPDETVCVVSERPVYGRTFADGWTAPAPEATTRVPVGVQRRK
ncbi:MAG: hypothetical protein HOV79_20860 [Hamadaea sp.]|nr:hypothetical protein [Hamadaea sp.]